MAASVAWGALAYLARPEVSYEDSEAKFSLVAERTSEISQDRLNTNRVVAFVLGLATGIVGTVVVRMLG